MHGAVARAVAEALHFGAIEDVACGEVGGEACCDVLVGEVMGARGACAHHLGATHGIAQLLGGGEGDAAHADVACLDLVGAVRSETTL